MAMLMGCTAILGIPSDVDRATGGAEQDSTTVTTAEAGGEDHFVPTEAAADDAPPEADSSKPEPDAGPRCDPSKDFQAPTLLVSLAKNGTEGSARLTDDERTLYFAAKITGTSNFDMLMATRTMLTDSFSNIAPIPGMANTSNNQEYQPNLTADGLSIFFERQDGVTSDSDLFMATRASAAGDFGTAFPIPGVNSPGIAYDAKVFMRGDGSELYYSRPVMGSGLAQTDIHYAKKSGATYVSTPLNVINDPTLDDYQPVISTDGLTLYFASPRAPAVNGGDFNVWVAKRGSTADDFGAPTIVPNVNSDFYDEPTWVSVDDCKLYMMSKRIGGGKQAIYLAERPL